jgi:FAD/FMN-containing dehydrogenase
MSVAPTASIPPARETPRYDIDGLLKDLGDIPVVTDAGIVRRKSRDYFWYSPILNKSLHGKAADVLVAPRSEADIVKTAAACAKRRIPITVRAGATGNYGQAVPLEGGVLLDINSLDRVVSWKPGVARLQAGARMHEIDALTRPGGWELRMHPSTKRMATIGGFVSGGSGGVGSLTYGGLREPGNILAARVVTMEETPRVLELRGDAAQKINRAYGTTGIITELEMPLAPAWPWIELVVAFDDFFDAVKAGHEIALSDGIVKKLLTPIIWPIPSYFRDLKAHCPDGKSILIAMIAEQSLDSFKTALAGRGRITLERPFDESPGHEPLYEYTWNHTTLQLLKVDRTVTYLQCLYPHDRVLESVRQMHDMFPDEVLPHLEFIRFGGKVTCSALPIVRYTTPERLDEIIALHEKHGVMIANPHVYTLEEGSRHKRVDVDQLGFKQEIDPHGLLNPGKMRDFVQKRAS